MLKNFLDDIDQVQIPDELLNGLDCTMDGSIKSEHVPTEMPIKQESLTPMHMSPQRSDIQHSPAYKPLIASDPLMASNFSPIPPMTSPLSSATMIPTTASVQQKTLPLVLSRPQHITPQHTSNSIHNFDTSNNNNGTGNIILQTNSASSPIQLNHLDLNNQAITLTQVTSANMSTIPSILYATTTASNSNNNTFILQAPQSTNNLINNATPEKKVQTPTNNTNTGNVVATNGTTQYKKIQSMPQVLTVQSIGKIGTTSNNGSINATPDKHQNILPNQAAVKANVCYELFRDKFYYYYYL